MKDLLKEMFNKMKKIQVNQIPFLIEQVKMKSKRILLEVILLMKI